ncbi:MAG: hypothetical protein OEL53_00535 [Rhodospirillales bacterium]|nr:hypothetical protein [Rhodospirillales bacterium]
MKQEISFIIEAGALPKEFLEALAMPPLPSSRFRITIEEFEKADEVREQTTRKPLR